MRTAGFLPRHSHVTKVLAAVVIVGVTISACGRLEPGPTAPVPDPTLVAPAVPPGQSPRAFPSGFFPLAVGNTWTYSGLVFTRVEGDPFAYIYPFGERHQLTTTLQVFGREYTVEKQTQWSETAPWPVDSSEYRVYYRQDRSGLYELDDAPTAALRMPRSEAWEMRDRMLASAAPDRRAALARALERVEAKLRVVDAAVRRGPSRYSASRGRSGEARASELTRLKYPLRPGQQWVIRDGDLLSFTAHVERHDIFDLPAGRFSGWRIHVESSLFDENDRLEVWYGRDGFLGLRGHFETLFTDYGDPYGNDSLLQITEQYMTLEGLGLAR